MDQRLARRLALSALAAGVAADVLFDRVPLGVNWPIAVAIGVAVTTWLRPRDRAIDGLDLWIPAAAILAALGVAVRADPAVLLLDLGLSFVGLLAWAVAVSSGGLTRRGVLAVAWLGARAGMLVGVGATEVAARLASRLPAAGDGPPVSAASRRGPILRGLLVALPVLFVFAVLLASADAVFGALTARLLDVPIDLGDLLVRAVFAAVAAWFIAGGLVVASAATDVGARVPALLEDRPAGTRRFALRGATEAVVVLVAVDVLFALFVVVQVAYLFGGIASVQAFGLTYSDYARQGYFQLVAAVTLAGLLLLATEALARGTKGYVPAALGLVATTAVILVSATYRLTLYLQAYGWSELRFWVVVSIAWLAAALILAAALVVRDRVAWVFHGLAMAAVAVVLAVTAIGPQAFVAQRNLDRALDPSLVPPGGRTGLDVEYVSSLGDDAIPILVDALPRLDPATRAALETALRADRDARDLRSVPPPQGWNLAREAARDALQRLP